MIECPKCHSLYSMSIEDGIAECYACDTKFRLKEIFVFYKNGRRYEFSNEPENRVTVELQENFYRFPSTYHRGEVVVIPKEVAKLIRCKILKEWKNHE